MGNTFKTKARKPSKDTDQQSQSLRQDAEDGNASNEKIDINQQPLKQIEVKSKEYYTSNQNIDTDQLPQQLKQDVLEGHGSKGVINIDVDMLPPHWKHHVREEPFSEGLINVDVDMLPAHSKHHTREDLLRDNIEWFFSLLAAYNQQKNNILDFLSKSNCNEKTIRYPDDMDDKAFDDFARDCLVTTFEIPSSSTETAMKQKLYDCIKKCLKKKMTLIKLGTIHKRLRVQEQEQTEKKCQKKKCKKDLKRAQDQVEQGRQKVGELERQLKQITIEKEHLLTRLSKIAGSKLTSNNPDIADLNDDNRPTKLAERFGQLYDDAWTDSMEELTGRELQMKDTVAISILLRIVMRAYQFCSGSRSMFLDLTDCQTIMTCKKTKAMKAITKLPDAIAPDIQQATKMCLRAKETSLISEMKEKFANTLNDILSDITTGANCSVSNEHNMNTWKLVEDDEVRINKTSDYCLHDVKTTQLQSKGIEDHLQTIKKLKKRQKKVSHSESVDYSQPCNAQYSGDKCLLKRKTFCGQLDTPSYFQTTCPSSSPKLAKTTLFAERCVELCWFMQTTQPPIHLSACIPDDGKLNKDIFRAYMKSGIKIDYIVWPVMYLYENGPVLNKGIAQPK